MKKGKNLNIWLAMSMFLLGMGGMAGGSAVDSNSIVEDGIEYCIQTDKSVYSLGENVEMLYRVTNLTDVSVNLGTLLPDPPDNYDLRIMQGNDQVWWYPYTAITLVIRDFILQPLETKEFQTTWDMMNDNGTPFQEYDDFFVSLGSYNVVGEVALSFGYERVPVSVSIEIIPEPAMIYYVDVDAPGVNDGSSWTDAYNYLQDALTVSSSGDEIWVAQGIYKPDQGVGITPGDRTATFQLINGVAIEGGYAGFGEPDPNARDIGLYETILSGDLNGDDIDVNDACDLWYEPSRAENSLHVVTARYTDETAILDGFTITGGNADIDRTPGAGMLNLNASPTVINCSFIQNSTVIDGGGMLRAYPNNP